MRKNKFLFKTVIYIMIAAMFLSTVLFAVGFLIGG